jgi:hypothetical protein
VVAEKFPAIFTTDHVARLIGLSMKEKWRVTKFVKSNEYGIRPAVSEADGPGTRRLYDLENVCEIALALRLLETGLRPMVIGKVLRQLRRKGTLGEKLDSEGKGTEKLFLSILRLPQPGKPLDEKREQLVEWVDEIENAERIRQQHSSWDLILVPMGSLFVELSRAAARELNRELQEIQELQQLKSI